MIEPKDFPELLPPPLVRGDEDSADEWAVVEAFIDLVADHYRLGRDDIWDVALDLDADLMPAAGGSGLAAILQCPWGVTAAARRIVERLLSPDEAIWLPPLLLSYH